MDNNLKGIAKNTMDVFIAKIETKDQVSRDLLNLTSLK